MTYTSSFSGGDGSSIPISELNGLIFRFVFVWNGLVRNPDIANLSSHTSNCNDGTSANHVINKLPHSLVLSQTREGLENVPMRVPRVTIEADANISVVVASNLERKDAIRRTMLFDEVQHSHLTTKAQPRRNNDVARASRTDSATRRWLQRFVRHQHRHPPSHQDKQGWLCQSTARNTNPAASRIVCHQQRAMENKPHAISTQPKSLASTAKWSDQHSRDTTRQCLLQLQICGTIESV